MPIDSLPPLLSYAHPLFPSPKYYKYPFTATKFAGLTSDNAVTSGERCLRKYYTVSFPQRRRIRVCPLKATSSEGPFDKRRTQTLNWDTGFKGSVCRPLTLQNCCTKRTLGYGSPRRSVAVHSPNRFITAGKEEASEGRIWSIPRILMICERTPNWDKAVWWVNRNQLWWRQLLTKTWHTNVSIQLSQEILRFLPYWFYLLERLGND